jgi:tetratricopeptide (TPR) repeat protein
MCKYLAFLFCVLLFSCKEDAKQSIEELVSNGNSYLKSNKIDSALIVADKALEQNKENHSALNLKLQILARSQSGVVEKFIDELPQSYPNSEKLLLSASNNVIKGNKEAAQAKAAEALVVFEQLLVADTNKRSKKVNEINKLFALTIADSSASKLFLNTLLKKYPDDFLLNKFGKMNTITLANSILKGE